MATHSADVLLGALCRLVDPLIRARTLKQWEAIAAYRELAVTGAKDSPTIIYTPSQEVSGKHPRRKRFTPAAPTLAQGMDHKM